MLYSKRKNGRERQKGVGRVDKKKRTRELIVFAVIVLALLAFGIQLPIDYGYGGAIYLKAKTTQLREHYMRNYGAIPFSRFDPFLLLIDGDAARELFGRYLKEV